MWIPASYGCGLLDSAELALQCLRPTVRGCELSHATRARALSESINPPIERYQSRTSFSVIDLDTHAAMRQLDLRSLGDRKESR